MLVNILYMVDKMRISVLLPVYNGMPYIREAVESVLKQELNDWELIVSDNGSTDGTRDYLRSLKDPRIRIYEQPVNLGIMGNLNFLLAHAKAPVARILGHDDRVLPGCLERTDRFMQNRPDCAISRCWALGDSVRYQKGGNLEWEGLLPSRLDPSASALAFATFGNLVGNICRAACRPQMVLQAGGFDQEYPAAGDYEAWLRVAKRFGLHFQNEELVFERVHEQQNSNTQNLKNEVYPQLNRILENLSREVEPSLLEVLRRHWTVHFFSPRAPRFIRQVLSGRLLLAISVWKNLPLNISAFSCFAAYPLVKWKLPQARITTHYLLGEIIKNNNSLPEVAK